LHRVGVGTVTGVSVAYSASIFRVSVGWVNIQSSSLRRGAVTHWGAGHLLLITALVKSPDHVTVVVTTEFSSLVYTSAG
jgi:hypothetical protein